MTTPTSDRSLLSKILRYGVVGAVSNGVLYLIYLGLTLPLPVEPLLASTLVFALGIGLTYLGNAFWAFNNRRAHQQSVPRYVAAYLTGYVIQIATLSGLTYMFGVPHILAQLIAMGLAAVTIFLCLNLWVFRQP